MGWARRVNLLTNLKHPETGETVHRGGESYWEEAELDDGVPMRAITPVLCMLQKYRNIAVFGCDRNCGAVLKAHAACAPSVGSKCWVCRSGRLDRRADHVCLSKRKPFCEY